MRLLPHVAFGLVALLVAGCAGKPAPAEQPWGQLWPGLPVTSLQAWTQGCVHSPAAFAGEQVVAVTNTSTLPLDLRITTADSAAAFFELDPVAPARARARTATLSPGRYRYACYFEEARVVYSAVFTVPRPPAVEAEQPPEGRGPAPPAGSGGTTQSMTPVAVQDLGPIARAYSRWVITRLPELREQAEAVRAAGEQSKTAWTQAHRIYQTLGAAYDAFGEAGDKVSEAFAAAESALWPHSAGASAPAGGGDPATAGRKLVDAVDALAQGFPNKQVDSLDLGLRAHEIVEDAVEKTLTGRDDHGSHTMLVTLAANLDGTQKLLDLLDPLLRPRLRALDHLRAELADVRSLVADGPGQQRLNAAFSQLAEDLAQVAAVCETRRAK